MNRTEIELLLSRATDDVSKQILAEALREINLTEKKRVKRDKNKESKLAKIVRDRRSKFYDWLSEKKESLIKNQTPQEVRIKAVLKSLNITYEFQKIFMDGVNGYIADFYLPIYNLVIEVDGYHHYTSEGKRKDKKRTRELVKYSKIKGILRLPNKQASVISDTDLKDLIVNFKESPENVPLPSVIPAKVPKEKKKPFDLPQKQVDKMTPRGKRKYFEQRRGK